VEEEEGGPGSRQDAWPVEAGGVGQARVGGGSRQGKIGEDEKPLTGGAQLLCWRFKSKQTDPKQFKQIRIQIKPIQTSFYPNMTFPSSKNLK
jgi:hypothetical protein